MIQSRIEGRNRDSFKLINERTSYQNLCKSSNCGKAQNNTDLHNKIKKQQPKGTTYISG